MKNINTKNDQPSRKGMLIRNLVMLLAALMWLPAAAQTTDTVSYTFLVLKDGTTVSGKIIETNASTITVEDFTLGNITIKKTQIVKETTLINGKTYCFTLQASKEYCGAVVSQHDSTIMITTASIGEISIQPRQIVTVTSGDDRKVVDGEVWIKNPHGTRYFFMPTAIPLKKGEGYFQNTMVLMNTVAYGITDHITVGGGVVIPFAYMATLRAGYELKKKVHVGGGIVVAGSYGIMDFGIGAAFGEMTLGDENLNCSFAAGFGFGKQRRYDFSTSGYENEWAMNSRPMVTASGLARISSRFAVVTENWFYPATETTYNFMNQTTTVSNKYRSLNSVGFRFMWEKASLDLALVRIPVENFSVPIPFVSYVIKF